MKVFKQTERKYYKYVDTAWTQPVLSIDKTLAGGTFAVQGDNNNPLYPAFNQTGTWQSGTTWTFYFYNPELLKISNLALRTGENWAAAITGGTLYGSVDGVTYDTLATFGGTTVNVTLNVPVSTNNYYKYFCVAGSAATHGLKLTQCTITATQRTVTNGTASDYDFYEDEVVYHIAKFNGKAYVEESDTPEPTPSGGATLNNVIISLDNDARLRLNPNDQTLYNITTESYVPSFLILSADATTEFGTIAPDLSLALEDYYVIGGDFIFGADSEIDFVYLNGDSLGIISVEEE